MSRIVCAIVVLAAAISSGPSVIVAPHHSAIRAVSEAAIAWPVEQDVTLNGQHYVFEETILGSQSGVGTRTSIEFIVAAEHVDKFVFATMADGPRTNSSSTLKIKKEWKNSEAVWQELASVGWNGGPVAGYPGIGIDSSDVGKLERFVLVNEFGSGCDLRTGTVEEGE